MLCKPYIPVLPVIATFCQVVHLYYRNERLGECCACYPECNHWIDYAIPPLHLVHLACSTRKINYDEQYGNPELQIMSYILFPWSALSELLYSGTTVSLGDCSILTKRTLGSFRVSNTIAPKFLCEGCKKWIKPKRVLKSAGRNSKANFCPRPGRAAAETTRNACPIPEIEQPIWFLISSLRDEI